MRNATLHADLAAFTADAANALRAEAQHSEVPFELVAEPGAGAPLYCYRPLTDRFIAERRELLSALPTHAAAVRALADFNALDDYLYQRGVDRVPADPHESAQAALLAFLGHLFAQRSGFALETERFEAAYAELELVLYSGQRTTTVIAPIHGLAVDPATRELALGGGLALVRGSAVPDAPHDAVNGEGGRPNVLITLTLTEAIPNASLGRARASFQRILSALRLYERGDYALGPLGWARADGGTWRALAVGTGGRPRSLTPIRAQQEDELRAFCNLVSRRWPATGELAWALARFEMGCERSAPPEALTDHLLALRALLEPEGPLSGRLPGRVAALCGRPDDRMALSDRVREAILVERAVIAGAAAPEVETLAGEVADHLRAILRDALLRRLGPDLRAVADEQLVAAASPPL